MALFQIVGIGAKHSRQHKLATAALIVGAQVFVVGGAAAPVAIDEFQQGIQHHPRRNVRRSRYTYNQNQRHPLLAPHIAMHPLQQGFVMHAADGRITDDAGGM